MKFASCDKTIEPVFIVSSGRAGSTLLSTLLNRTGEIFVPPESDFIVRAYRLFCDRNSFDCNDYDLIATIFRMTSENQGWGLSKECLVTALMKRAPHSFAEVIEAICDAYFKENGITASRWAIKRPLLIASIPRLKTVFPNSKIIHIYRDGRDVYLSYKQVHDSGFRWGPNGVITSALYWVDGLRRIKTMTSDDLYEVKYEDLISQPSLQLQCLCEFLEIPYSDRLLDPVLADAKAYDVAKVYKDTVHRKVFSQIDVCNKEKYQREMKKTDLFVFECVAEPLLKRYKYKIQFKTSGLPLFMPLRVVLYKSARWFNDWRYRRRDSKIYRRAVESKTARPAL